MKAAARAPPRIAAGFRGQVHVVLPRPFLRRAAAHPLAQGLHPTDIGWFPRARHHYRERPQGAEEHIVIVCRSGAGWLRAGGRRVAVRAGEALVIPARAPHAYGADPERPWSIHWSHVQGDEAGYCAGLRGGGPFVLRVQPAIRARVAALFAEAERALSQGVTLPRFVLAAQAVRHILGLLLFGNRSFHPLAAQAPARDLDGSIAYLRASIGRPLRLADMAQQAGLSVPHFSELFRRQTGHSPVAYFIQLKMRRACLLLDSTAAAVKEVAAAVGCEDPYYFSRLFKKVMGVSPAQYRAMQRG